SAAFDTRSRARSILSNPSRKGLDRDGTRDMVSKPSEATLTGPFRHPSKAVRIRELRPASPNMGGAGYGFKNGKRRSAVYKPVLLTRCHARSPGLTPRA